MEEDNAHTILLMGLDESGKTSLFNHYFFGEMFSPTPTDVFEENVHEFYGHNLRLREIGGRYRFKPQRYDHLKGAKAIIWVFDSIDQGRKTESWEELTELLSKEEVAGLPLLFIANKQESKFAMPWDDIKERFQFEEIEKQRKVCCILTTFYTCEHLTDGLVWILDQLGLEPIVQEDKETPAPEDDKPQPPLDEKAQILQMLANLA